MDSQEFLDKEEKLLAELPVEFRSTISVMAYERGHAYGHNEVLGHVQGMVYDLLPAIQAFESRIRSEKL
jgi:hypothetical protein